MFADDREGFPIDPVPRVAAIDRGLRLLPLAEAAAAVRCDGSSRFYDCGEDAPDVVLTCFWLSSGIMLERVQGFSTVPYDEQLGRAQTVRWLARVPRLCLPPSFRTWEHLQRTLQLAPSCHLCVGFGGNFCFHSTCQDGEIGTVVWSQPHQARHRRQLACIWAYRRLSFIAWLYSFVPGQQQWPRRIR